MALCNGVKSAVFGVILALIFVPLQVQSLYVHIYGSERKCYQLEVPDDTLVAGNYTLEFESWEDPKKPLSSALSSLTPSQRKDAAQALEGVNVEITDPQGSIILSKVYGPANGRFRFTSHTFGDHKLCFNIKWSRLVAAAGKYRFHLNIKMGGDAIDYAAVIKKEKLSNLQLRIRQVADHVEQITKEQNYQRAREERFRRTSESTNRRVLFFAMLQTVIILCMGYYHVHHLKNFFIAKKLV